MARGSTRAHNPSPCETRTHIPEAEPAFLAGPEPRPCQGTAKQQTHQKTRRAGAPVQVLGGLCKCLWCIRSTVWTVFSLGTEHGTGSAAFFKTKGTLILITKEITQLAPVGGGLCRQARLEHVVDSGQPLNHAGHAV